MDTSCDRFCWMTAQVDRIEHAVTDDAQAIGMKAGKGWFEPLCGGLFLVACMDIGPDGRCPRCLQIVRARANLRDFELRLTEYRRPGWLSRLLRRYEQPAGVGGETTVCPVAPTSAGLQRSAGVPTNPGRGRGRHAA